MKEPAVYFTPEEREEHRRRFWEISRKAIKTELPRPGTLGRLVFELKYQVGRLLGRW